jgi:hypothetical protein
MSTDNWKSLNAHNQSLGARWACASMPSVEGSTKNSAKCVVVMKKGRSFQGLWVPPLTLPLPPLSHYSVSLAAAKARNPFCHDTLLSAATTTTIYYIYHSSSPPPPPN